MTFSSASMGDFVHRAVETAFGRCTVVAENVDDECVVGIGKRRHRVQHAPHLVVDLGAEAGEDFHHPRVKALLVDVQRIPRRQTLRGCREFGIGRNHTELLLPLQGHLAIAIPPHVELALELVDPFLRRHVRRMRRGGGDMKP